MMARKSILDLIYKGRLRARVPLSDWSPRAIRLIIYLILTMLVLGFWQCWLACAQGQGPDTGRQEAADRSTTTLGASESLAAWTIDTNGRPRPEVKPGKEFWTLVITDKAFKIWDIELTQRGLKQGWIEQNPLLPRRPTRARMYVQFMGLAAGADYWAYRLRRSGHPQWARIIQFSGIGLSLWGIQSWYPGSPAGR